MEKEKCLWLTEDECDIILANALTGIAMAGVNEKGSHGMKAAFVLETNTAVAHKLFKLKKEFNVQTDEEASL